MLAIKYSYSALIGVRQYSTGGHTMVAPAPLLHVQLTPQCINPSLRCSQTRVPLLLTRLINSTTTVVCIRTEPSDFEPCHICLGDVLSATARLYPTRWGAVKWTTTWSTTYSSMPPWVAINIIQVVIPLGQQCPFRVSI